MVSIRSDVIGDPQLVISLLRESNSVPVNVTTNSFEVSNSLMKSVSETKSLAWLQSGSPQSYRHLNGQDDLEFF
jgi:hypothetical protein